ncbi:CD48 antigen [Anabarilius grahami]|uniref:CD48 antigen n=1 Tax=Anabarilius grahami TaxID=495550 RepID=A0A3N0XMY1_ANAGA|nr:CD48 antigen [Anabarilius grahami]
MFFRRSHILWILIICEAVSGDYVTKAVNSETAFTPVSGSVAPSTTSIIWKHRNNAGVVVKVIEWDRDDGSIEIPNANFKSHTRLDKGTGELTLKDLQLKHTGVYTIDINSKEQRKQFSLTVIEHVNKPRITKDCLLGDVPECTLSCDGGDGPSEPTITWKNSAGETLYRQNMRTITVTKSSDPENFYTCTLKNAVSEETSDPVYERDLFDGVDVMKAVGDQVSFHPDKSLPPPVTSIIWKHINTAGIVVKAIEWDEGEILIPNPRFRDITTVDEKTGQINITNLKVEHSGVYTIDINSKEQQQRFTLTVMERVPKPVIEPEKIKDNPLVVNLTCKYSETIIWKNSAGQILPGLALHPKGEFITVEKKGNLENSYTCTLKNAVSEETSARVNERDLFKKSAEGHCM